MLHTPHTKLLVCLDKVLALLVVFAPVHVWHVSATAAASGACGATWPSAISFVDNPIALQLVPCSQWTVVL
jgi:hypothetical protein